MTHCNAPSKIKSRLIPALIAYFYISNLLFSASPELKLLKVQELLVSGCCLTKESDITSTSTWSATRSGYILQTPHRLFFFSHSMDLTNAIKVGELSPVGIRNLTITDDTLVYVLESNYIDQYNTTGDRLNRWFYPNQRIRGQSLAVWGKNVMIGGQKEWFALPNYTTPKSVLYDLHGNFGPVVFERFFSDSLLALLNSEKNVSMFLYASVAAFSKGFVVVCNANYDVFLFSPVGQLEYIINTPPPGYKGLLDVTPFDIQKAVADTNYMRQWQSTWDYSGGIRYGIAILDDSFLVVPRRTAGEGSYCIDIYNLYQRCFITRFKSNDPLIGVSSGLLFFLDSLTKTTMVISAFRITLKDTVLDSLIGDNGCERCGRPLGRYEYVNCPTTKMGIIDTIPAGQNRTARVFCNSVFEPKNIVQFCANDKKNMFVFISPSGGGENGILIDSLATCLKNHEGWMLTTVVCHHKPEEIILYLLDLPGDQILINRNVSIPDSTYTLSDLGLPPMAIAFSEGGRVFLGGYSLAPNYDRQKITRGFGLSFGEFLNKCGITHKD